MSLILRVDVDKPYGHSNIIRKVASKVAEDFFPLPIVGKIKYLSHLIQFLEYCNSESIPGFIYHRTCATPTKRVINLLKAGNHQLCFHAENTCSYKTFDAELQAFQKAVFPEKVESFTKHGSGTLKLGKHHYPPYEPEKYKEWAITAQIAFYFGNGIGKSESDLRCENNFFKNMFWMEHDYRHPNFCELQQLLDVANTNDVVVLIHPSNYHTYKKVADDFKKLITLSKEQNVGWKIF